MPAKHASPKKLRVPEWYVSSFMMDRALDAVVRQIVKLDRRQDIPYFAGYSRDGKTIYIDRHMPKWFTFQARRINTDRFLILHELVEKALIDHLGLRSSPVRVRTAQPRSRLKLGIQIGLPADGRPIRSAIAEEGSFFTRRPSL